MEHLWTPWRMQYIHEHKHYEACVFCTAYSLEDTFENLVIHRGKHAFVIMNRYPYNNGHLLIVPVDHCAVLGDLDAEVQSEMMQLATHAVDVLKRSYKTDGFNVGFNLGTVAGAGIADHIHMHVIPRWLGDTNFLSIMGKTRVLPEELSETYQRLRASWQA